MGSTFGERALQKHRTCATFGLTRKSTSLASLWLYQFVYGGKGELRLEAPSGLRRTEQVYEVYVVIFDLKTTNIKKFPKYGFSERNPTNHVAGVFVQALSTYFGMSSTISVFFTFKLLHPIQHKTPPVVHVATALLSL